MDALTLTSLGGVLSSAVTGNLVLVGLAASRKEIALLTHAALAILAYGLGVLCCQPVLAGQDRAGKVWPARVTVVIAAELVLLIAAFIALVVLWRPSGWAQYAVLILYALVRRGAVRVAALPALVRGWLRSVVVAGLANVWCSRRERYAWG